MAYFEFKHWALGSVSVTSNFVSSGEEQVVQTKWPSIKINVVSTSATSELDTGI
jgi:hypothetical protein